MGIKIPPKLKDFSKKLFTKERLPIILLVGVLLVVISIPVKKQSGNTKEADAYTNDAEETDYVTSIENRLEEILRATEGVGQNKVMITVKNTGKDILYSQMDISSSKVTESGSGTNRVSEEISESESVLYTEENGTQKPYVQGEEMPEIVGVFIIAEGAGEAQTVTKITEAASTLLGVPVNKIKVLKMEVGS